MEKNILICLEKLGIGGVETAVINQAIALKEKGNKVVVLAGEGIYSKVLQKNGIETIKYNFNIINQIDFKNKEKISKILDDYKIDQVHIHQLPCIQHIWKVCLEKKIPYIAFVHSIAMSDFEWFFNTYPIYKIVLEPFYKYAQKIVVLAEEAVKNHQNIFSKIPLERYYILPNCINFDIYSTNKKVIKVEKFALISRLSKEKITSINNGIDLFLKYAEETKSKNIRLDIIGDGLERKTVEDYINKNNIGNAKINILGESNDIKNLIEDYDAIIGIGRCMLEAISMKKIAILSGIEELKGIILPENIDKIILKNFVGRELPYQDVYTVINELKKLDENKINEIVEENYIKVKKNLNIKEKIYYSRDTKIEYDIDELLLYWIESTNKLLNKIDKVKKESSEIWEAKLWLENKLKEVENNKD